jgi:hypothetical protein
MLTPLTETEMVLCFLCFVVLMPVTMWLILERIDKRKKLSRRVPVLMNETLVHHEKLVDAQWEKLKSDYHVLARQEIEIKKTEPFLPLFEDNEERLSRLGFNVIKKENGGLHLSYNRQLIHNLHRRSRYYCTSKPSIE